MASFLIKPHLDFDPDTRDRHDTPSGYSAGQVIQRSIEAYINGGRHGDPREPLADFIVNELCLHGWNL